MHNPAAKQSQLSLARMPQCLKCSDTRADNPTNYLLTCSECNRSWHHRSLRPPRVAFCGSYQDILMLGCYQSPSMLQDMYWCAAHPMRHLNTSTCH
ncbi:hypothetical protein B0H10DRAFT_1169851 [Mycena sp. CBHHK59/15]|nr:hypothetical protein B0H10DRAFT_1169851 [Mycena sp. CBHHK59/15]